MKNLCLTSFFFFVFLILSSFYPKHTFAAISSCTANVDVTSIQTYTTYSYDFYITNNDSNGQTIAWIQITRPSSDYNLVGGADSAVFTDSLGAGSSIDEYVHSTTGGNVVSGLSWTVKVSDDPNGADPTTCTGSLGAKVFDPNNPPPAISSVVISDVSDSSVVISWVTDKNATSELDYGLNSSYGSTKTDNNPSTSHSFTLNSLGSNTTYHFNIKATDASGTTELGNNTFTTAKSGSAGVTQTVTTTVTRTVTPTPTPTPTPDTTAPSIYTITDLSKPFDQSPEIVGTVKDNRAVSKIEYSLDNGKNFLEVDNLENLGKTSTSFSFTPPSLDDGNYEVKIRAYDSSGNVGYSKASTLIIDRIPPQASGVLFSLGSQVLIPKQNTNIFTVEKQPLKITLSEVGGATQIDVYADNYINESHKFSLLKNPDSGLWSGNLILENEGQYDLKYSAIDGAGNKTEGNLNKIIVSQKGKINAGNANITVYFFDKTTSSWKIWDGSSYGQKNPSKADADGNYSLFLPAGKYYLQVDAWGYQNLNTEFFTLSEPTPINANFSLKPLKLLADLKIIKLYWPDFLTLTAAFKNNLLKSADDQNLLLGKKMPFFSLSGGFQSDSLSGKPSILTFSNTWSPPATEQISILNNIAKNNNYNSAIIIEGEKSSKIYVFKKRGSYNLPMYTDPDATLVTTFNLNVLPTSYFIDRKGIIRKVISGVLSEEEIIQTLASL